MDVSSKRHRWRARARYLAFSCGQILARIHSIDHSGFPSLAHQAPADLIEQWHAAYRRDSVRRPVFDLAFHQLSTTRPPPPVKACLVHGDFRNGNLMIGPEGVRAVLDWELAHIGDPMEDLGWLCVNSWRFGRMEKPVGGFGEYADLYAGYEAAGGSPVNREMAAWWETVRHAEVGRHVRRLACRLPQCRCHRGARNDRSARIRNGNRSAAAHGELTTWTNPPMQDEPSPREILGAIADFLRNTVIPNSDPHTAFQARVAANAVDLVRRQLEFGITGEAAEVIAPASAARPRRDIARAEHSAGRSSCIRFEGTLRLREYPNICARPHWRSCKSINRTIQVTWPRSSVPSRIRDMDFSLPAELIEYLAELDRFIEAEIKPLQAQDDNERFFDHRREHSRTDWDNNGLPRPEWEALLGEARRRADAAGHLRFGWPKQYGGRDGSNLWMAVIREHLAALGLGLHNDLQNEHSIVGNNPFVILFREFATRGARSARWG